jgi:hypothetical protein
MGSWMLPFSYVQPTPALACCLEEEQVVLAYVIIFNLKI